MKIKSKFKDYYDHISYIYGADPSITYDRKPLENVEFTQKDIPFLHSSIDLPDGYQFKWLSVCAKLYCLVIQKPQYWYTSSTVILTSEGHGWKLINEKHPMFKYVNATSYFRHQSVWSNHGKFSEPALELTKKVGAPVFTFDHGRTGTVRVDENIPILGDIGLAAVYPAEQLYQDLSYFIVNTMKDSPDMAKPSSITDKEKISSHGFDLKMSFRHRK